MILQLSSGVGGPVECEYAVGGIFRALRKEYDDIEPVQMRPARMKDCYTSIIFTSERDLSELEGTIQWTCLSPFRPGHKRKNWFIDVSVIPEQEEVCTDPEIRIEKFHCGGHGGQNVNKVETGIRVIHIPTGITVTATRERSQFANKQEALRRLASVLDRMRKDTADSQRNAAWREHSRLVRGNPARTYVGMGFERKN